MEINTCSHNRKRNMASWWFCLDCNTHIADEPDTCRKCAGKGKIGIYKRTYIPELKGHKVCTGCKGTGKQKPIPCTDCSAPSVFAPSSAMGADGQWRNWNDTPHSATPINLCQCCYDKRAAQ
jgi:hypothetical protein